jgi:threonine dehydratase/serine racemase
MTAHAIDLGAVRAAAARIAGAAHVTPVMTCATLDVVAGRRLFFKCENFQKVGAFKFRGACSAVMQLSDEVAARGVVTHSSGNHAQAIALAARMRGIAAHIVMPSNASEVKRRAVEGYGARVIECEPTLEARERTAARVIEETGATLIPPFDHPDVIAGQGTVALELIEQVASAEAGARASRPLDAIVAPVGGGGLVSGISIAAHGIDPRIRVFAAEPTGADDAERSKAAGERVMQTAPKTICDGLLTSLGELTWPIIRDHVERVITVPDAAAVEAMRLTWERAKLLVEPSAAIAVAAVFSDEFQALEGIERVGVVLSGGNVDLDHLPW